jgi:hypothetical protein
MDLVETLLVAYAIVSTLEFMLLIFAGWKRIKAGIISRLMRGKYRKVFYLMPGKAVTVTYVPVKAGCFKVGQATHTFKDSEMWGDVDDQMLAAFFTPKTTENFNPLDKAPDQQLDPKILEGIIWEVQQIERDRLAEKMNYAKWTFFIVLFIVLLAGATLVISYQGFDVVKAMLAELLKKAPAVIR